MTESLALVILFCIGMGALKGRANQQKGNQCAIKSSSDNFDKFRLSVDVKLVTWIKVSSKTFTSTYSNLLVLKLIGRS